MENVIINRKRVFRIRNRSRAGKRYGKLLVIKELEHTMDWRNKGGLWLCRCDCGEETEKRGYPLNKNSHCGCSSVEMHRNKYSKVRKYSKTTINNIFNEHRRNGRKRGSFLSKEDWLSLVFLPCYYCGGIDERNYTEEKNYKDNATMTDEIKKLYLVKINGIDRLDSSIGYIKENCLPCCCMCNRMKLDHSKQDFFNKITEVYNKNQLNQTI